MKSNHSVLAGFVLSLAVTFFCGLPALSQQNDALAFNGSQVVSIPHLAAQDAYPLTVMCWFMEPTNSPGGGALVGNYVSSSFNGWSLAIDSQLYAWYWRDHTDDATKLVAGAVNDGLWHHAAFVVDSGGGHLYLDGVLKQTIAWAGTAGACTTTIPVYLGIYQGDSFLTGDLDEVSIWNVALTQSQIQTYMHQSLQGNETGLVDYYRMNEGTGTNIFDSTINADTGVLATPPPSWILSGAQIQGPPQVVTLPATVNSNSPVLNGTLNPQGLNSGSWFRWGLTTNYGNLTATNTFAANYVTTGNTGALSNLAPAIYHFQMVATNALGTNYGGDQIFTIAAPFLLGNTNVVEGPASGADSVVLSASPTNASWTATANASWLHLSTGYQSGTGSTNIIFSFDTNSGATRSGTLTIAGQPLAVTQAGSTYVPAGEMTGLFTLPGDDCSGIAVDGAGNVFAINDGFFTVMEWTPTNNALSTIIQTSSFDPGPMVMDSAGNLYIGNEYPTVELEKWTATNGVLSVLATGFGQIDSMAIDRLGNVYLTDPNFEKVEEWVAASNSVVTIASGVTSFGVAVDEAENVYYSDYTAGAINERMAGNGHTNTLTTFSSGVNPFEMTVDGGGNLYIATATGNSSWNYVKWSPVTGSQTTLFSAPGLYLANVPAVDSARNAYFGNSLNDDEEGEVMELPYAFVDPTARSEPGNAGSDSLPPVLPARMNLNTPFAPTSDQSWLTITGTANGVVSYSFTANTGSPRTAHIGLLGESIPVTQSVLTVTPPQLTAQLLGNNTFQFTFTNTPGTSFTVLATTNLTLPLTNWVNLGTVSNISPGMYQFTSPLTNSQEFYQITWP